MYRRLYTVVTPHVLVGEGVREGMCWSEWIPNHGLHGVFMPESRGILDGVRQKGA